MLQHAVILQYYSMVRFARRAVVSRTSNCPLYTPHHVQLVCLLLQLSRREKREIGIICEKRHEAAHTAADCVGVPTAPVCATCQQPKIELAYLQTRYCKDTMIRDNIALAGLTT